MPAEGNPVHSDPEILGGTPVFVGTRVPVRILMEYLAAGDDMAKFLDHFPTVSKEQAVAVLNVAREALTTNAACFLMSVFRDHCEKNCPAISFGQFPKWVGRERRTANYSP